MTDTTKNGGERNVSLNKWKQAGQVLNIIQFEIPTIFHIFDFQSQKLWFTVCPRQHFYQQFDDVRKL